MGDRENVVLRSARNVSLDLYYKSNFCYMNIMSPLPIRKGRNTNMCRVKYFYFFVEDSWKNFQVHHSRNLIRSGSGANVHMLCGLTLVDWDHDKWKDKACRDRIAHTFLDDLQVLPDVELTSLRSIFFLVPSFSVLECICGWWRIIFHPHTSWHTNMWRLSFDNVHLFVISDLSVCKRILRSKKICQ